MRKTILLFFLISIFAYPVCANGFTTKAISEVDDNIILDVVADGGGQSVAGEWSSLNNKNLTVPLKISIGNIKEVLFYPILNQGVLYGYNSYYLDQYIDTWAGIPYYENPVCPAKPAFCFELDGGERLFIVERIPSGSYAAFGNPDISFVGEMSLSVNGTTYKEQIGSGEEARGSINFKNYQGEHLANIIWTGSLITGTGTPNQDNYIATQDGRGYRIAPKTSYEKYVKSLTDTDTQLQIWQNAKQTGLVWNGIETQEPLKCADSLCSDILNLLTIHNSILNEMKNKNVKIGYEAVTSELNQIGELGNTIITRKVITNPELVITLRASKIGIIKTIGKPKIEKIIIPSFNEGDNNGYVRVFLSNIGTNTGTFSIRSPGMKESKITLAPAEAGEVILYFQNATSGNFTGEIEIYDINSGETDKQAYSVNVITPKTFIPNTTMVFNDVVTKSDETGMKELFISACPDGVFKYQGGKYDCFAIDELKASPMAVLAPNQASGSKSQIIYPETDNTPWWIVYIMIGLIILILILYVIEKIVNVKARGFKRKNLIGAGTILFILALAVAILLFVLWPQIISGIGELWKLK